MCAGACAWVEAYFSKEVILSDVLDVSIVISFLFVAVSEVIIKIIISIVGKTTEDDTKLRTDYSAIVNKCNADILKMVRWQDITLPVIELYSRKFEELPFKFDFVLEDKSVLHKKGIKKANKKNQTVDGMTFKFLML